MGIYIIDYYNDLSQKIIKEDKDIAEYEKDLKNKKITITSMIKDNILNNVVHPFRLIRLVSEKRRLVKISEKLDELENCHILPFMYEESGDTAFDAYNVAYYAKPKAVKDYMEDNKIYIEEIDKKLRLIKK